MGEVICGLMTRVIFQKQDFVIAEVLLKNQPKDSKAINFPVGSTIVKGSMDNPQIDVTYEFSGTWVVHPKYGRQFSFSSYKMPLPTTNFGIKSYLIDTAPWIGDVRSSELVKVFGEDTLKTCKDKPELVAEKISGITIERAREISESLKANEYKEEILIEVRQLLGDVFGVTSRILDNIFKRYKLETVEVVRSNPYRMVNDVRGVGFKIADAIGHAVGIPRSAPIRIEAGLVYSLEAITRRDGYTGLPEKLLLDDAGEILGAMPRVIKPVLKDMLCDKTIVVYDGLLFSPSMDSDEKIIASTILRLAGKKVPFVNVDTLSNDLAEDQVNAVRHAVNSRVFILTGPPGTGKTYTIRYILKLPIFNKCVFALAAPTGKAARRMGEMCGRDDAKTIHRLLGPRFNESGMWDFEHHKTNPLEADVVIIDEVSMVDCWLMARLCSALGPDTRLILVGDTYQLPSVGPGSILRDLIESKKVPSVELTTIKRQDAGLIIQNCHKIKDGEDITVTDDDDADFQFFESDDPEEIHETIIKLVTNILPSDMGIDGKKDIQVITALREQSVLSCAMLNTAFQAFYNKDQEPPEKCKFFVGDKVIQTKNDYTREVMNGDIGIVREVNIPAGLLYVDFHDVDKLNVLFGLSNDLELAYAITCHKYQGSEAKVVVIPIHECLGKRVPQRNWIYTAISRAEDLCILVGNRREASEIIRRGKSILRLTGLKSRLTTQKDP